MNVECHPHWTRRLLKYNVIPTEYSCLPLSGNTKRVVSGVSCQWVAVVLQIVEKVMAITSQCMVDGHLMQVFHSGPIQVGSL